MTYIVLKAPLNCNQPANLSVQLSVRYFSMTAIGHDVTLQCMHVIQPDTLAAELTSWSVHIELSAKLKKSSWVVVSICLCAITQS